MAGAGRVKQRPPASAVGPDKLRKLENTARLVSRAGDKEKKGRFALWP